MAERREDIEPNLEYELNLQFKRTNKRVRMSREVKERFLQFAEGPEGKWPNSFRDLKGFVIRVTTLAMPDGIVTHEIVQREIERLRRKWQETSPPKQDDGLLLKVLGPDKVSKLDVFDRIQLDGVIRICQDSSTCAEAGRKLFAATRHPKSNDSARLAKYLKRFGLCFHDLAGDEAIFTPEAQIPVRKAVQSIQTQPWCG